MTKRQLSGSFKIDLTRDFSVGIPTTEIGIVENPLFAAVHDALPNQQTEKQPGSFLDIKFVSSFAQELPSRVVKVSERIRPRRQLRPEIGATESALTRISARRDVVNDSIQVRPNFFDAGGAQISEESFEFSGVRNTIHTLAVKSSQHFLPPMSMRRSR